MAVSAMSSPARMLALCAGLWAGAVAADGAAQRFGLGQPATRARIAAMDIAIGPRGEELPQGRGTSAEGAAIYAQKCAMCHGASGREGPDPALVGGHGSLAGSEPLLTVGSYWPYATTLYDYIYRAMPLLTPASLTADEVYALTAFLLHSNGIIAAETVVDQHNLAAIRMPNRDGFVPDARPDVPGCPASATEPMNNDEGEDTC